jgi:hypothetical protein
LNKDPAVFAVRYFRELLVPGRFIIPMICCHSKAGDPPSSNLPLFPSKKDYVQQLVFADQILLKSLSNIKAFFQLT